MVLSLYDTLKSSYGDKQASQKLANAGYKYDSMLSNHNQQVWYNPNEKKLLYNVAGTHNLADWGTDAYLAAGKLKDTNRYKEADSILKQAKLKYNPSNTSVSGHSLGATIANYISAPTDKTYALDAGYTIGQKTRDYGGNHQSFRTAGDLVSALGAGRGDSLKTLKNSNWLKDPLTAHHVENIKNEQIFV